MTGNANLNWLSLARCFLFASRDFWFEVPLPFFLRSPSCRDELAGELDELASGDQAGERCGGLGWSRVAVGAILGAYIIVYGQCQSWTPQLVLQPLGQSPPNKQTEILWGVINCIPTAVMAAVCDGCPNPNPNPYSNPNPTLTRTLTPTPTLTLTLTLRPRRRCSNPNPNPNPNLNPNPNP